MTITLNGNATETAAETVFELLNEIGLADKPVVIEHNQSALLKTIDANFWCRSRRQSMTILPYALGICLIAVTISMLLCLIRLIIGPSIVDRLLALDTLFLNAICLIIILGIYWASTSLFEGALLVAMLGFVSTAALARYFTSGHVID